MTMDSSWPISQKRSSWCKPMCIPPRRPIPPCQRSPSVAGESARQHRTAQVDSRPDPAPAWAYCTAVGTAEGDRENVVECSGHSHNLRVSRAGSQSRRTARQGSASQAPSVLKAQEYLGVVVEDLVDVLGRQTCLTDVVKRLPVSLEGEQDRVVTSRYEVISAEGLPGTQQRCL